MNKEKFIKLAIRMGYATKTGAEKYVKESGKEEFTEEDLNNLYLRRSMHWSGCACDKGLRSVYKMNGKTTAMSNGIQGTSGSGQDWR